jgi:HAE1 family hydrophobic/amphiphilic exporter-1
MNITETAVKRPVTMFMILACFIVLGIVSAKLLPLEFFPSLDAPFLGVEIPYPGSTPEEIERQITKPAEEVLATISGIKRMSSESGQNGASINLEFDWGIDANVKALEAKEKLEGIRHLFPSDLRRFYVRKFSTSDMEILVLRISSDRNLANSYDMLDRNVKRRIERIEGVSRVDLYGVEKKEVRIQLLADRLIAHRVDIAGLVETLRRSNFLVTAGTITEGNRRLVVRPMSEFSSVEEIGEVVVGPDGLRLRDVATISYEHPQLEYGRHLNRRYAIGVDVFKESGANLVDVTNRIIAEIDEIGKIPEMTGISIYYMDNQAEGVVSSLREILRSGLLGACFAVAVLFFFLRRFSTTFIIALAAPLSILVTLTCMYFLGVSLNILSMLGLMLAIGMLVDNAVVVTESIHRRQILDPAGKDAAQAGVREVALAVTAGTLTTAIVFLPNILSPRDEIAIYLKHIAITICIALGASLLISQTLVPMLASRLRPPAKRKDTAIDRLQERYGRALAWTLAHRRATVLIIVGVLLSVAVPMKFVKTQMFGDQDERRLRLFYNVNGSYTLEKVEAAVDVIEEYLFARQDEFEIESVYSVYGHSYATTTILLETGKEAKKSRKEIEEAIRKDLPTIVIANPSFDFRSMFGDAQSVRVQLVGKSSEHLAELSRDIAWTIERVPGFKDVRSEAETGEKEVRVVVDRERARQQGFSAADVAQVVSAAMRGIDLPRFRGAESEIDVRLEFQDSDRRTLAQLENVPLMGRGGDPLTLASVADFSVRPGPRSIRHENRTTSLNVTANLDGITMGEARKRIAAALGGFHFPPGYTWNYGEGFRHEREALNSMLLNLALALALIYFVMASLFESLLFPAAIWTQILFAVVGVYWFFLATGTTMTMMGMIGILILIGVVVNNGIVLVDHINRLREDGLSREDAIARAGRDRMRPILMTAATTVLNLLPLSVIKTSIGGSGGPPYFPMARAIVGGLTLSTLVTLLLLPTIYILLDNAREWARRVRAEAHGGPALAVQPSNTDSRE